MLRRLRWWLMASIAGVDRGGKCRWMRVGAGGSGRAIDHVGRGWCRVVMAIEVDGVDSGGGKGVDGNVLSSSNPKPGRELQ